MRVLVPLLTLSLSLLACAGLAQPASTLPASGATLAGPTPSGSDVSAEGPVPVTIHAPRDETTVNVPQVEVRGTTVANAVITINDDILVADAQGEFSAVVPLEDGPNAIEIVVSDLDGNETFLVVTVTYDSAS